MARTVICISHATGAGGRLVGEAAAEQLGFRLVDEEVLGRAAERSGLSPGDLADVERRKSLLGRLLDELGRTPVAVEGWAAAAPTDTNNDPSSLRGLIRRSIEEIAEEGGVVIVSHAASYALGARDDVLRVLVTAPVDTRVDRIAAEGLEKKAAERAVAENDAARAAYLKRFYGTASESPTDYDLVVNTETVEIGDAARLVGAAAG